MPTVKICVTHGYWWHYLIVFLTFISFSDAFFLLTTTVNLLELNNKAFLKQWKKDFRKELLMEFAEQEREYLATSTTTKEDFSKKRYKDVTDNDIEANEHQYVTPTSNQEAKSKLTSVRTVTEKFSNRLKENSQCCCDCQLNAFRTTEIIKRVNVPYKFLKNNKTNTSSTVKNISVGAYVTTTDKDFANKSNPFSCSSNRKYFTAPINICSEKMETTGINVKNNGLIETTPKVCLQKIFSFGNKKIIDHESETSTFHNSSNEDYLVDEKEYVTLKLEKTTMRSEKKMPMETYVQPATAANCMLCKNLVIKIHKFNPQNKKSKFFRNERKLLRNSIGKTNQILLEKKKTKTKPSKTKTTQIANLTASFLLSGLSVNKKHSKSHCSCQSKSTHCDAIHSNVKSCELNDKLTSVHVSPTTESDSYDDNDYEINDVDYYDDYYEDDELSDNIVAKNISKEKINEIKNEIDNILPLNRIDTITFLPRVKGNSPLFSRTTSWNFGKPSTHTHGQFNKLASEMVTSQEYLESLGQKIFNVASSLKSDLEKTKSGLTQVSEKERFVMKGIKKLNTIKKKCGNLKKSLQTAKKDYLQKLSELLELTKVRNQVDKRIEGRLNEILQGSGAAI